MPFELIIARYGLAAICVGAGIEGETAVMAGGVLAHQQMVSLPSAVIVAAAGSFLADQGFFSIGRHFREGPFVQRMLGRPAAHRAIALLERYPDRFILAIRFLYGIRTLSPIAVGTSDIARARFMALNAVAAVCWALLFTGIGYELGDGLKTVFRHVYPFAHVLLGALIVMMVVLATLRIACRRLHHRTALRSAESSQLVA